MDGVDTAVPFSVRASNEDALNLAFELDDASTGKVKAMLERLSSRQAA
jgi:hypothetical protein